MKDPPDRLDFGDVSHLRRGGVGVDVIDILRRNSGPLQGQLHGAGQTIPVRLGQNRRESVGGLAVAAKTTVYGRPPFIGKFFRLQDHRHTSPGADEAVMPFIEGPRGTGGIRIQRQRTHRGKGKNALRIPVFRAYDDHPLLATGGDLFVGRRQRVPRGGTGGDEAAGRSPDLEMAGQIEVQGAGDRGDDRLRLGSFGTVFAEMIDVVHQRGRRTGGSGEHARPLLRDVGILKARVLKGILQCAKPVKHVGRKTSEKRTVDPIFRRKGPVLLVHRCRVEAFDRPQHMDRDFRVVKTVEAFDPRPQGPQAVQNFSPTIADTGDKTKAGCNNAVHAGRILLMMGFMRENVELNGRAPANASKH